MNSVGEITLQTKIWSGKELEKEKDQASFIILSRLHCFLWIYMFQGMGLDGSSLVIFSWLNGILNGIMQQLILSEQLAKIGLHKISGNNKLKISDCEFTLNEKVSKSRRG